MQSLSVQVQPFVAWLLRSTLQASMLIGLILLVQIALRSRLSPRWSHALWLILLVRMVLPWAPQSRVSIFNLIPHSDSPVVWGLPRYLPNGGLKPTLHTSVSTSDTPASAEASLQPTAAAVPQPGRAGARQAKSAFVRAAKVLPLIWLAGALGLSAYIFASSLGLLRIVRRERPVTDQKILDLLEDCKAEMGIRTTLGVVATDKVKSACLFGFVRPRLLLPKGMIEALNREELRYVFLHELGHLKRHDIWLGWLTSILQALHWFNPLIWLAFYRIRADRELACDALVLGRTQADESRDYGRTIVSLLERFSRPQVLPALAGILETKSQLKRRITMIAKSKKSSPVQRAAAVLIFAALASVGLTDAYPAPPPLNFGTPTRLAGSVSADDAVDCFSSDGLEMYICSQRAGGYGGWDFWVLSRASKNDDWGSPVNLGPGVNSSQDDYLGFISADGLMFYFSSNRPGGYGGLDIYTATRATKSSPWLHPVNLGSSINSSGDDRSPWTSPDGLELFITSYRAGGYGYHDIYASRRATTNYSWGQVVNLGFVVNSAYGENYPSLSPDGLLLFFNDRDGSFRPGGYGLNDMWMSRRASLSDPWQAPVNLGPVVNGPGLDTIPRMSPDGTMFYFQSDRGGTLDNWQAPILAAPTCGDSEHPYPAVDLNKDCRVDFADLALLLAHWLECTAPECD